MKKKIFGIALAAILLVGGLYAIQLYQDSQLVQGAKAITIIVKDDQDTVLLDKVVRTDAETLGELLDELAEDKIITIELAGDQSDVYGRYIVSMFDKMGGTNGPWWLFESDTNPTCVSQGFCNGIDMNPILDQDVFVFFLGMGDW
jgi:hypothetical protein